MGYPGIRLEMVMILFMVLFYSDNLINHWENLDIFEGVEFTRTPVIVERYDEVEVQTYIYTLKRWDYWDVWKKSNLNIYISIYLDI